MTTSILLYYDVTNPSTMTTSIPLLSLLVNNTAVPDNKGAIKSKWVKPVTTTTPDVRASGTLGSGAPLPPIPSKAPIPSKEPVLEKAVASVFQV